MPRSNCVTQHVHEIRKEDKRRLLSHLIRNSDWGQVLVFTRTKHGANRLTKQLEDDGINASAIHGNKSQSARTKALNDFKQRQDHGAGRHRSGIARSRYRPAALRHQLRIAECSRGLRAPYRPHRPGRVRAAWLFRWFPATSAPS